MTWQVIGLIVISVAISALAQVALKHGMSTPVVQVALATGGMTAAWAVASNIFVLLGLGLYGAGALLWLGVLAQVDVSQAYPFVGLGFVLTMVMGNLVLGESVSALRLIGTLMIIGGVICLAKG